MTDNTTRIILVGPRRGWVGLNLIPLVCDRDVYPGSQPCLRGRHGSRGRSYSVFPTDSTSVISSLCAGRQISFHWSENYSLFPVNPSTPAGFLRYDLLIGWLTVSIFPSLWDLSSCDNVPSTVFLAQSAVSDVFFLPLLLKPQILIINLRLDLICQYDHCWSKLYSSIFFMFHIFSLLRFSFRLHLLPSSMNTWIFVCPFFFFRTEVLFSEVVTPDLGPITWYTGIPTRPGVPPEG